MMNKHLIAGAIAAAFLAAPMAASASEAELLQRIEKMAAELEQLKSELRASVKKTDTVEQRQQALTAQVAAAPAAPAASAPAPGAGADGPATVVTGYGEINYNRPSKDASAAQSDVRRAVIGVQHRFDDKTKVVAEYEFEHAVVSASDKGEAEVEQLYLEREFGNGLRGKAGLFLMPVGLLNTNHEPTAYYGVERNFVETAIIPSTWREVGLGLSGEFANGLNWDAGVTTGFDLNNWGYGEDGEGRESPLGSIHQEGMQARSRDLSVHGALNWRGLPGLLLGGSVFTGKAGHKSADFAAPDARITLFDLHARYTPGPWDLSALYARGQISHTGALNLANADQPNPVPSAFAGWYLQAAYQLLKSGDIALNPFMRYERFNTAKHFSAQPPGLEAARDEKVTTVGANLRMGEGVVLKADYQKFSEDNSRDRLNLGVGFSY